MIKIRQNVWDGINNYVDYLTNSKETSEERALEKRVLMIQSLMTHLGYVANGTTLGKKSIYKGLGSDEGCYVFVHQDKWSKKSKWGFAYKVDKRKNIFVLYMQNMQLAANSYNPNQQQSNNVNPQQNNQQNNQQQPQYKPVSKECFGFTRVQSTNGSFNYLKSNKLFCKQWYKDANDFQQFHNGRIATKVFDGQTVYWLYSDNYLEKAKPNSYIPEHREITNPQILFEESHMRILDVMKKVCKF